MRLVIVFMVSVLTSVPTSVITQESAQYLESAISNLKDRLNVKQNFRRIDNFPTPKVSQETTQAGGTTVPSLALTKGELTALYESALNKGQTVTLNNAQGANLQALVHEIDQTPQSSNSYHADSVLDNDAEGYYYYYYPLKSFIDGFSQGQVRIICNIRNFGVHFGAFFQASPTNLHNDYQHHPHHDYHEQSIKPTAQYLHSHTHQVGTTNRHIL